MMFDPGDGASFWDDSILPVSEGGDFDPSPFRSSTGAEGFALCSGAGAGVLLAGLAVLFF